MIKGAGQLHNGNQYGGGGDNHSVVHSPSLMDGLHSAASYSKPQGGGVESATGYGIKLHRNVEGLTVGYASGDD